MKPFKLWKIILLLVLVFLAGGIAGSVVTHVVLKQMLSQAFDFDRWPDGMVKVLEDNMELSGEQKAELHAIGTRMASRLQGALDGAIANSGSIIVETQREVDAVLTPEQRLIHARMKADFRKHLKEDLGVTLPDE